LKDNVTFKLGPIIVRVEGIHLVTAWVRDTFAPLLCESDAPDLLFRFTEERVHPCGAGAVGDKHASIGDGVISYPTDLFEMRITSGAPMKVELYQRDRRPLWLRSVADVEESYKMWLSHGASIDMHLLKTFTYELSPLSILCALLSNNAALIHASGFSVNGEGVLLPAWGGGGKSTVCSRAVLHGNARFLADDHAVIDSDGMLHLHLLPIHTYHYHLDTDGDLKQRVLGTSSTANRLQWSIATTLRRHRAVRWASPVTVFGDDKIAVEPVPIKEVILLFRGKVDDFVWEEISPAEAAKPAVGVMLGEIYDFTERIAKAECGWHDSGLPSIGTVHEALSRIYEAAFSGAACSRLLIPSNCDGDRLVAYLRGKSPLIDRTFNEAASGS
jgi:hypothetical protein